MMKLFKNNRGSVLPIVMIVGAGTIAILGYSFKKFDSSKKEGSRNEVKGEERLITGQIKGILSSRQSCLATFGALSPSAKSALLSGNASKEVELDELNYGGALKTTAFKMGNKFDKKIELTRFYVKDLSSPPGNTYSEEERSYMDTAKQGSLMTTIRTGTFVAGMKNLKTGRASNKEMSMRFVFQNGTLIDCYGIEKSDTITNALKEQCESHKGVFNPSLQECQFSGRPLFSTVDNNSVYCQMDKNRILAQGYGNMSFCPNSYQWGGCIFGDTVLASRSSTIYASGKLDGAVHAFKTSKKVNFDEGALAAAMLVGGFAGAAVALLATDIIGWCKKKEYHYCAYCNDGKIELKLYKYRYEKKKDFSCKWKKKTYMDCK